MQQICNKLFIYATIADMRIAFTGKGGSGKTTISSLFALHMAAAGKTVLALDADINQHLAAAIGYSGELRSMGEGLDVIKRHLCGTNMRFTPETMHKTTPPGRGSRFVRLAAEDWFLRHYAQQCAGVWVAGAGEIPEGNIGVKCYHGLNGAVELVLGHLLDRSDEVVVVDMTAGADAFSSSLFTKVDALVVVVEPTLKSLSVYRQFAAHAARYGVPLVVVGNKVISNEDRDFIEQHTGSLVACFNPLEYVRRRERGTEVAIGALDDSAKTELSILYETLARIERNWEELERRSHEMHQRNAASWMGAAALTQIDPDFSLREYALRAG